MNEWMDEWMTEWMNEWIGDVAGWIAQPSASSWFQTNRYRQDSFPTVQTNAT